MAERRVNRPSGPRETCHGHPTDRFGNAVYHLKHIMLQASSRIRSVALSTYLVNAAQFAYDPSAHSLDVTVITSHRTATSAATPRIVTYRPRATTPWCHHAERTGGCSSIAEQEGASGWLSQGPSGSGSFRQGVKTPRSGPTRQVRGANAHSPP